MTDTSLAAFGDQLADLLVAGFTLWDWGPIESFTGKKDVWADLVREADGQWRHLRRRTDGSVTLTDTTDPDHHRAISDTREHA